MKAPPHPTRLRPSALLVLLAPTVWLATASCASTDAARRPSPGSAPGSAPPPAARVDDGVDRATTPPAPTPVTMPAVAWVRSPFFRRAGRAPADVDAIVIHTTEGNFRGGVSHAQNQARNYIGTVRWFTDNPRRVSAHFVVGPDGAITQMVDAADVAAHATYYNARSIGIECAGWGAREATWTPALLDALVELCAALCIEWEVPVVHPAGDARSGPHHVATDDPDRPRFDAPGLVGHHQIQPWNKRDPGAHFPWDELVARVRARVDGAR